MRIAVLASNLFDLPTGQQKIQRAVIRALAGKYAELLIITNARRGQDASAAGVGLDFCRFSVMSGSATWATYLKGFFSIRRAVKHFKPDLFLSFGGASVALANFLRRKSSIPWVHFSYEMGSFRGVLGRYFRYCLNGADEVICTSRFLKSEFLAHGVTAGRIVVLKYNFGDPDVMALGSRPESVSERKNLLFWGDAVEDRGIDILLKIIPRLLKDREITFSLVLRYVDENYRERLQNIERLPRVKIEEGPLSSRKLREALEYANIIILPYIKTTIHPPLTLLESVGSGKLVITTDVEANREVIGEEEDGGILIPPQSEFHIRNALDEALSNFKHRSERLQHYLRKEKWLVQPDGKQLESFFSELTDHVVRLKL